MGGGTSKASRVGADGGGGAKDNYSAKIINERCPLTRLDAMEAPKEVLGLLGSDFEVDIKYCCVSQRGYYPNALTKANQDSYLILEGVLGDPSTFLFGVFDGHGETGDFCSYFAADNFATCLAQELRDAGGAGALKTPSKMSSLYTSAFVKTNKLLRKSNIDDSLSGTTGVTILMSGDTLYVGNVGDSRAIIASEGENEKLVYAPLSSDQTPFRKDERERLKKRGAVIMTIEQIEGNEEMHENWGAETGDGIDESGDPPRVWDNSLEKPGCAFTRSIGDAVAEKIGVFAEPELLTWKLQPNDRFAIVASDGVFEFLSSQAVVDMVSKFSDIVEGCKHVVAEAYRLWLQFDERTDDITMIIISFEDIRQRADVASVTLTQRVQLNDTETARPVRTVMSKSKRKEISENFATDDNAAADAFDVEALATPKSEEQLKRIAQMLKSNFLFQNLDPQQRDQIFKVMQMRDVSAGAQIITEGAAGEEMYLIDSGEFTVLKKDDQGQESLVFTYTNQGASFGELSLMYGKPRAASVRAKTDGRLWVIGRLAFRAVLMKRKPEGLLKLFKAVPLFRELPLPRLQRLASSATTLSFSDGDVILAGRDGSASAGSSGEASTWCLCIILSGGVVLTPNSAAADGDHGSDQDGPKKSPRRQVRTEGMFLAEVEVGMSFSSAVAEGRTKLSCIPTQAFSDQLGSGSLFELRKMVREKNKGKTSKRRPSKFSTAEFLALPVLSAAPVPEGGPIAALGSFATVGLFSYPSPSGNSSSSSSNNLPPSLTGGSFSAKLISKRAAVESKMDARMLLERQILAAMTNSYPGSGHCLPKLAATYADAGSAYLVYADVFRCDLQVALANGAISEDGKTHCAACIYSAVAALHDEGIFLRFINPESIYLTDRGVPKIVDLRYAKKMDGSKAFTICGDACYFAPEIVTQRGYDHGADLWALGVLFFEIFEGFNPIGSQETDETTIFKKLASFAVDSLAFSKKTPKKAKSIITALLEPDVNKRLGYGGVEEVKEKKFFNDVDWDTLGDRNVQTDISSNADPLPADLFAPLNKPSSFDEW